MTTHPESRLESDEPGSTLLVGEIGALAAEQVETILTDRADDPWPALVAGGWHALGVDPDEGADLRGLQEVARVVGRHTSAVPLLTTLLVGRWTGGEGSVDLDGGVSCVVASSGRLLAPYAGTTPALVVLDGQLGAVDPARPDDVETFSSVMPVTEVEGAAPVEGARLAELAALLAAAAVGCADAVVERSASWVQTREQFGQPIGRFQAVRHHLADMHIGRELAWTAALAAGQDGDTAVEWARQACELAIGCIETGIQVHGGVGFTWEVGLQHYLTHVVQIRDLLLADASDTTETTAATGAPR